MERVFTYTDNTGKRYAVPKSEVQEFFQYVPDARLSGDYRDSRGNAYAVPDNEDDMARFAEKVPDARDAYRFRSRAGKDYIVPVEEFGDFLRTFRNDDAFKEDRDEIDKRVEELASPKQSVVWEAVKGAAGGSWLGLKDAARGVSRAFTDRIPSLIYKPLAVIMGKDATKVGRWLSDISRDIDIRAEARKWDDPEIEGWASIGPGAFESVVANLVPAIATHGTSAYAMPALYGLSRAFDVHEAAIESGHTPEQAIILAAGAGVIEGGMEYVSMLWGGGKQVKEIGKAIGGKELARNASKVLRALVIEVLTEAGTEGIQEFVGSLYDQLAAGDDIDYRQAAVAAGMGAGTGAMAAIIQGGPTTAAKIDAARSGASAQSYSPGTSPQELAAWTLKNPEKALELAGKESPSRKDFEAAGLPRVPAAERSRIAADLKELTTAETEQKIKSKGVKAGTEVAPDVMPGPSLVTDDGKAFAPGETREAQGIVVSPEQDAPSQAAVPTAADIDGAVNRRKRDDLMLEKGQYHAPGLRLGDQEAAGAMAYLVEKGEATLDEWNEWVEKARRENRFSDKDAPVRPPLSAPAQAAEAPEVSYPTGTENIEQKRARLQETRNEVSKIMLQIDDKIKEADRFAQQNNILVTVGRRRGQLKKALPKSKVEPYNKLKEEIRKLNTIVADMRENVEYPLRKEIEKAGLIATVNDASMPKLSRLAARVDLYIIDGSTVPKDIEASLMSESKAMVKQAYPDATEAEADEMARYVRSNASMLARDSKPITPEWIRDEGSRSMSLDISGMRRVEARTYAQQKGVLNHQFSPATFANRESVDQFEKLLSGKVSRESVDAAKKVIDAEAKAMKAKADEAAKQAAAAAAEEEKRVQEERQAMADFLGGDLEGPVSDLRKKLFELGGGRDPTGQINPKPVEKKVAKTKDVLRTIESHASKDLTRLILTGVHVGSYKQRKVAVATDGTRLIVLPYDGDQKVGTTVRRLPPKQAKEMGKEYEVIDGVYPNFALVVPPLADLEGEVPITPDMVARLRGAVKAARIVPDNVSMSAIVTAKINGTVTPAALNAEFVLEAIDALTAAGYVPTKILMKATRSPVMIVTENKHAFAVIMPLTFKAPSPTSGFLHFYMNGAPAAPTPAPMTKGVGAAAARGEGKFTPPEIGKAPSVADATTDTAPLDDDTQGFAARTGTGEDARPGRDIGARRQDGGQVAAQPTQPTRIIDTIRKLWPGLSVRSRATWTQKKTPGWYSKALGEMRLANAGDIIVAVHELGHHFDRELGGWSGQTGLDSGIPGELLALGHELYGDTTPKGGFRAEGFAEFVGQYLTGGDIQAKAPKLYHWFTTEYLPSKPAEAAKLRQLEDVIAQFQIQTPEQAIQALLSPRREDWSGQRIAATLAGIEAQTVDAFMPLLRGMMETGAKVNDVGTGKDQIRAKDHPYMLAIYFARTSGGRALHALLENTTDLYGKANGESLKAIMAPAVDAGKVDELIQYWIAKRVVTRYHDHGLMSGLAREDAQAIIDKYASPEFDRIVEGATDWAHRELHLLVDAGVMTEAQFNEIVDMNPIYAPMMRQFLAGEKRDGGKNKGLGKGVFRVRGGQQPIVDPLTALAQQSEKLHQIAMQHAVMRSLVQFYDSHRGKVASMGKFMSEVPAPREAVTFTLEKMKKTIGRKAVELGADPEAVALAMMDAWDEMATIYRSRKDYRGGNNIIGIEIDGKRRFFEIQPDLFPILEGVTQSKFLGDGKIASVFRRATSLQRLGATGLNPAFGLIRNLLRDTGTAAVTADYHFHIPLLSTLAGMVMDIANSDYAKMYHGSGLDIAGRVGQDLRSARKAGRRVTAKNKVQSIARAGFIDGLVELLGHSEVGPRLMEYRGAFKHAKKMGWDDHDALVLAGCATKDVTVNFSRAGTEVRKANEVIMFANAGVQSLDKIGRSLGLRQALPWAKIKNAEGTVGGEVRARLKVAGRTTARALAYITIAALMNYIRNRNKEWWKKLPAFEKWNYLHVGNLNGDGCAFRIPLPFEIGALFGALPVAMLEEKRDPGAFKEALEIAIENSMPIDIGLTEDDFRHKVAAVVRNFSLFTGAGDILINEDWKGSAIVPRYLEGLEPDLQYTYDTTSVGKLLGKHLGIAPAQVDHLLNTYTGQLYKRVYTGIQNVTGQGSVDIEDKSSWPVIGTLFLRPNTSRVVSDFYDRLDELERRYNSDRADGDEINELKAMRKVSGRLTKLWRARREALEAGGVEGRRAANDVVADVQAIIEQHNEVWSD